jgi:hypothetical protein
MSDARHELSMQLATGFAAMCLDYLPVVEEGVRRSNQKISFGTKIEFWSENGLLRGRMTSSPPKIPARKRPRIDFVLQMTQEGQLEFVFEGTPKEMEDHRNGADE